MTEKATAHLSKTQRRMYHLIKQGGTDGPAMEAVKEELSLEEQREVLHAAITSYARMVRQMKDAMDRGQALAKTLRTNFEEQRGQYAPMADNYRALCAEHGIEPEVDLLITPAWDDDEGAAA